MQALIEINEADLAMATRALASQREYVIAILSSIERRKAGLDAAEALDLLSRANALERAKQALAGYRPAVVAPEPGGNPT